MTKGNTLKFLEGAAVGVALAVAADIFLSSKKGKALKNDVSALLAGFYKSISPEIKKMGKIGEREYKAFVKNAADQYAKAKNMPTDIAVWLVKKAQKSWKEFSKNLD